MYLDYSIQEYFIVEYIVLIEKLITLLALGRKKSPITNSG
jgi:hypothetical protein